MVFHFAPLLFPRHTCLGGGRKTSIMNLGLIENELEDINYDVENELEGTHHDFGSDDIQRERN